MRFTHGRLRPALLGLALAFVSLASQAAPREFHVASDGNDANPGTPSKPWASLEAARDAVRRLKAGAGLPRDGVVVWVHRGTYPRTGSFVLTEEDGGTPITRIRYQAWGDDLVRLSGGRVLRDWASVSDPAVTRRLPAAARDAVRVADLHALGLTNLGKLRSRGFGRPVVPAHLELFFRGRPMTLARWPNAGAWETIAGIPEGSGGNDDHGGQIGGLTEGFLYAGDRPAAWQASDDLWVHGYWAWDWANSYERVASLEPGRRLVRTAPPHGLYGFRKGQRFYFLNVLEELDEPGEWYLDRAGGRLYFWPPESLARSDTLVSLVEEPLVSLQNVSWVTLRGFTLEAGRGDGVRIQGGTGNRIEGCRLRWLGNYGVRVEGGSGHLVSGCDIQDTGDGGVQLEGGDRQTLTPGGHAVENCHFQRQGRWSKCYVPAVLAGGVGHRIAHNLIEDHPHCAILFTGNEHQVEFNEIHHVALETGDVGAIYTGRDWTFRGNRIRFNFIHDTGGVGMGSMGIYMDDCVSGTEIRGNVFRHVTRAVFLGGGRDHQVVNNVFLDCDPAVALDGRGLDRSPVWHNMVYDFMKKQRAAVPAELYRQRYPALVALDPFYEGEPGVPPEGNVVSRNVCVGGHWTAIAWHARPEMIRFHDNYVGTDPGFEAPERLDFRLKNDSPLRALGFEPIPMDQIGLRPDAIRKELERRTAGS